MKDYLEELCHQYQVELVYTNNKVTVLSTGYGNDVPTIRAHNLFKYCPEKVAKAILQYYVRFQDSERALLRIEEYVKARFTADHYILKPPEPKYKELLTSRIQPVKPPNDEASDMTEMEMDIFSMTHKDFWGNATSMKADDTIKPGADEVVELDIVVDKMDTYHA